MKQILRDTTVEGRHMRTMAAIMGILQAIVVIILLSTTAVVLERWQEGKWDYDSYNDQIGRGDWRSTIITSTATIQGNQVVVGSNQVVTWRDSGKWWNESGLLAFLKVHLIHHIAFYSLWLIFLVPFALAFRYYRSKFVLPNLIMQVISLVMIIILAAVVIAKMVFINRRYNYESDNGGLSYSRRADMDTRYAFYAILLSFLIISWVAELVFIFISLKFYRYLRDMPRAVYHGVVAEEGTVHSTATHATVNQTPGHRETHVTTKTMEQPKVFRESGPYVS